MISRGFWKNLPKPFFALAPMADVTDCAFRRIIAKYSKWEGVVPDFNEDSARTNFLEKKSLGGLNVMWTEFVSADGLIRANEVGKKKLLKDLEYSESERPIVAQLFSGSPEYMEKASALCLTLGFDGVDINMGCPDKGIEKQGAGAAMIKNPKLAREVIAAAKRGAKTDSGGIPVSIKTRTGFNKVEIETWIPEILKEGVSAITVHARTRKEMSKVPANWGFVLRARELRDEISPETLIIGNGDVKNIEEGMERVKETGCDGVMIGRGIFGNPFLFAKQKEESRITNQELRIKQKLEALKEHTLLFEELLGATKNFAIMKKHFKAYITGIEGAGELRDKLMQTENAKEVEEILNEYLKFS